jgi:putative MATE family efflux protein
LTQGPIAKTLFFFTLPVLFGNVLQSLNGSVNSIWIGHYLGEAALTASANSNAILFFLIGSIFGIAMAATILIGQSIGASDLEQAKRVVGTSVTFFSTLALVVSVAGYFLCPQMMTWMHTPADALPLAVAYMRILFLAVPFLFTYTYIMMVLRGAGDSKTPFLFLLVSVGLDIALNPVFIFGVGPIPAMGIAGSATATLLAQIVSLAALIGHLYRTRHFLRIGAHEWGYLRPDHAILGALIKKGVPMGLHLISVSLSMIVLMSLVNHFGSQTSAAYGACLQLWNYIQMPSFAVGMAVSSMVAQNVGARRWDRVHRIAQVGVLYNFLMTGGLVGVVYLLNRYCVGLFLPENVEALPLAQHINLIVSWSYIFLGVTFVLSGVMRATGAVIMPVVIVFFSLWLIRIPFASITMEYWQADAIWYSFPLGSLVAMILSIAYYRYGPWQSAHMLEPQKVAPAGASDATLGAPQEGSGAGAVSIPLASD